MIKSAMAKLSNGIFEHRRRRGLVSTAMQTRKLPNVPNRAISVLTTIIALPWYRDRQQTSALGIDGLTLITEELFIVLPERRLGLRLARSINGLKGENKHGNSASLQCSLAY